MKKYKTFIVSIIIIFGIIIGSYFIYHNFKNQPHSHSNETFYTCPMHPEIIKNLPGSCPICGMNLVLLIKNKNEITEKDLDHLILPTDKYIIGNFNTIRPIDTILTTEIVVPGSIEYDPNASITIVARITGRLEKMNVKYKYQTISKGEKLFEIYSPELLTEQQNLLYILKNDEQNTSLIEASKQKLLLYGMTQSQINNLILTQVPNPSIAVFSPINGIVLNAGNSTMGSQNGMENNLSTTEQLNLNQGSYIQKNTPIFKIQNVDKVWGVFSILQEYSTLVNKGMPIKIISELQNQAANYEKIDFIETQLNDNEKTTRIRTYINNKNLKLPVGTRLTGILKSKAVKGIFIKKHSFVTLGSKQVVFIKNEKNFYAKEIQIGLEIEGYAQVLKGLNSNDEIAENAQYLTDSESFIKIK